MAINRNDPMSTQERKVGIKSGSTLVNTGERLVPALLEHNPGTFEYTLHLARYAFAARYVHGVVLDVACGTGYGSSYLLQTGCNQVIGVDVSPEALKYAVTHHGGPRFIVADGQQLPFQASKFSAVITLETIEHVANPDAFVRELHRVLRPGGCLILSTPNYRGGRFLSPFHVRELRHEELNALLSNVFHNDIAWFGQLETARDEWSVRIVRGVVESIVALDRFNLRSKLIPYWLRAPILHNALGIRGEPGAIFAWEPTCLYQIAALEKGPRAQKQA